MDTENSNTDNILDEDVNYFAEYAGVPAQVPPQLQSNASSGSSSLGGGGGGDPNRRISTGTTSSSASHSQHQQFQSQQQQQPMSQDERRKRIKDIMADPNLGPKEKSLMVQSLMDGRRRSSSCTFSQSSGSSTNTNNSQDYTTTTGTNSNNNVNSSINTLNASSRFHDSIASNTHVSSSDPATRYACSMAEAAAIAAEYYSSDDDEVNYDDDDNDDDEDATMSENIHSHTGGTSGGTGGGTGGDFSSTNNDEDYNTSRNLNDDATTTNYDLTEGDYDDNVAIAPDYLSYGSYDVSDNRSVASNYSYESISYNGPGGGDGGRNAGGGAGGGNNNKSSAGGGAMDFSAYKKYHGRSMSLQDWTDTDRAVAPAVATTLLPNPKMLSRLMEQSRPPCSHYDRNCTIISPCCGLAFGCRICHDECPILPPPLSLRRKHRFKDDVGLMPGATHPYGTTTAAKERRRSMPLDIHDINDDNIETHHLIDRFSIREVICRQCFERQSSKTNNCMKCGIQFSEYHCIICNLWMSNNELPYHCEQCGFCRVGGRNNFTHCIDCGMCIDTQLFDDHNCKAGKYMSNCPICQEDLFSSRFASHEMPCGHAIHWDCFKELTSYDTRCPVCKKTAENPDHMQAIWSAIAMGIALQPVPPEMARVVNIFCNDCEVSDSSRRWHFLGVQCYSCSSFNTVVEQIVLSGQDAADFLDDVENLNNTNGQQNPTAFLNGIPTSITAPYPVTTGNSYLFDPMPPNPYSTTYPPNNDEDDNSDMDHNMDYGN